MAIAASIILFVFVYTGLMFLVIRLRPSSVIVAFLLPFPLFICLESVILNVLSLFHAVNRSGVIWSHLFFVLGVWGYGLWHRRRLVLLVRKLCVRMKRCFVPVSSAYVLIVPLLLIISLTAFLYAPNTWDSMTYHMARVAHWMQQGSVDYYVTNIRRQNEMGPGAEYLILFFQAISGTDRLANSVQWMSFLLIPFALYYLLRLLRINRQAHPWIILICMTTPMAVLQASSTQNDLVDALLTLCIIIMVSRLVFGNITRMSRGEMALAALCIAAGFLVKPISMIVALPFVLVGFIGQPLRITKILLSVRGMSGVLVAVILFSLVCGPDIARKSREDVFSRPEVYPLLSEWDRTRLYNPVATMAPNFPFPDVLERIVQLGGLPIGLHNKNVFNVTEDFIGNPLQLFALIIPPLLALIILPLMLIRKSSWKKKRVVLLTFLPVFSWCAFGWIIKNQAWLTRLQLPLFFLLPFSLAFLVSNQARVHTKKIFYFCWLDVLCFLMLIP